MEGTTDLHTTNKLKNLKPTGNQMMASDVSTGVMKGVRIHHTSLTGLGSFLSILAWQFLLPSVALFGLR